MSASHVPAPHGHRTGTPRAPAAPRPRRTAVVAFLCAVALAVLTACGSTASSSGSTPTSTSSSPSPAAGSGDTSSAAMITIKDFAFTTPASVSPGATIMVHNQDGTAHTVTADRNDAFDSPAPAGNSSFTAPTEPGTYPFHCTIHPEMHGTLVVK